MRQRVQLKQHPRVQSALARLWDAANTDCRDQMLDRAEYGVMHRKILLALAPILVLLALGGCAAQREDPPSTAELVSLGAQNLPSFPRSRPPRLFPKARAPFPRFPVSTFPRFEPLGVVLVFRVVSTLSDPSEERRPVPLAG